MPSKNDIEQLFHLLEQSPSIDTFSERKKLQKLVYLSEVFDIDFGFTFTWYVYGPYSPQLTRIMFDKENGEPSKIIDNDDTKSKADKLRKFLGDDINSSNKLELIASLHYLASLTEDPLTSKNKIFNILLEQKPHFTKEEVEESFNKIVPLFHK